jgi:DNA repair protein RadC
MIPPICNDTLNIWQVWHSNGLPTYRAGEMWLVLFRGVLWTSFVLFFCEEDHPKIASKDDVTKILAPHIMFLPQEEFRVILLDAKQKLIRIETVSLGSLDKALVEPRDVFRPAITFNAASLVIVHNHPSGDTQPSEQDVLLTRELCMCGIILGIEVLDHIIIGVRDHVSFRERGLL